MSMDEPNPTTRTKLTPAHLAAIKLQAARYIRDLMNPNCRDQRRRDAQRWAEENPLHRDALVFYLGLWTYLRAYPVASRRLSL